MLHPQRLWGLAVGLLIAAWAIDHGRQHSPKTQSNIPLQRSIVVLPP